MATTGTVAPVARPSTFLCLYPSRILMPRSVGTSISTLTASFEGDIPSLADLFVHCAQQAVDPIDADRHTWAETLYTKAVKFFGSKPLGSIDWSAEAAVQQMSPDNAVLQLFQRLHAEVQALKLWSTQPFATDIVTKDPFVYHQLLPQQCFRELIAQDVSEQESICHTQYPEQLYAQARHVFACLHTIKAAAREKTTSMAPGGYGTVSQEATSQCQLGAILGENWLGVFSAGV